MNKSRIYSVAPIIIEAAGEPLQGTVDPTVFKTSFFTCGRNIYTHSCFYLFKNVDITVIQASGCNFKVIETNFPDPLYLQPYGNYPLPPNDGKKYSNPAPYTWDNYYNIFPAEDTDIIQHTNEIFSYSIPAGKNLFTYPMTIPCDAFYIELKNNNDDHDVACKIIIRSHETV